MFSPLGGFSRTSLGTSRTSCFRLIRGTRCWLHYLEAMEMVWKTRLLPVLGPEQENLCVPNPEVYPWIDSVVSARWATVDWSWHKEWNYCARANLNLKKAQAGNEWSNILPKSSQARKSHHHHHSSWWLFLACEDFFFVGVGVQESFPARAFF